MATAEHKNVLRVRRLDPSSEPLLVQFQQRHRHKHSLNLKIIATDEEHLYHGELEEAHLQKIQTGQFAGSPAEWKEILISVLLSPNIVDTDAHLHVSSRGHNEDKPVAAHDIELVANVQDATATITIRRNISGITQKLGVISLQQDDEREEVAAFEWVHIAASETEQLREQVATLQRSLASQQQQITQLTAQLDDLVSTKKSQQEQLLIKFAALLNTKKLKIRDQQRLLQGAQIDPTVADQVHEVRPATGTGKQTTSSGRGTKRKAGEGSQASANDEGRDVVDRRDDSDDGDDAFEAASLPSDHDRDMGLDPQQTPQQSDAETTADEDEPPSNRKPTTTSQTIAGSHPDEMDVDANEEMPPRRELPFGKRKATRSPPRRPAQEDDGAADDETDDEL